MRTSLYIYVQLLSNLYIFIVAEGGADNAHIDVALDGSQWDGNGEDAGGFNPRNNTVKSGKKSSGNSMGRIAGAVSDDDEDADYQSKPVTFDDVISNLLRDNDNAKFDWRSNDTETQDVLSTFAEDKKDTATGEAALKLSEMFNSDGEFVQSNKNRKALGEIFGEDLTNFGQRKLNERWSDLLKKSMQPNFTDDLSEDDRKFFGNILKRKLKEAGVDLKGMGRTLQGLEKGDKKTFVSAWQAIQDRLKKSEQSKQDEQAEPFISPKTQQALDDIAQRIDELTAVRGQNAPQIAEHSKLYKEIAKLNADINKLIAEQDKLAQQPTNTQAAKIDTASKIAKIDADIQKKQSELDAKIDNYYNPAQEVKVEPSRRFAPIKAKADSAIDRLNQQIETLKVQGVAEDSEEIDKLLDDKFAIQAAVEDLAKLDEQTASAKRKQTDARKANDAQIHNKAKKAFESSFMKYKKKEQELLDFLNPPKKAEPTQEIFEPVNDEVSNGLAKLARQKAELRTEGGRHKEITELNQRRKRIQDENKVIAKLQQQAAILEQQLSQASDWSTREKLEDQLDSLNVQIDDKTAKLVNYINPPQKVAPKKGNYAPVNEDVSNELSRLNRQILDMPDEGANGTTFKDTNKRIDNLLKLNNEVGQNREKFEQAQAALEEARVNGDEREEVAAKSAFETAKEHLAAKQKALQDFLYPPVKEEKKPESFDPVNEDVARRISDLNARIDAEQTSAAINEMRRQREAIENQNNAVLKLQKQLAEQQAIMDDTTKSALEKRKAKELHANIAIKFDAEKAKLDELLNPRNEDDELVETYEPVNPEVKAALEELERQIASENEPIKKEVLERQYRELQNQNDIVAKLQASKQKLKQDLAQKAAGSKGYKKIQSALDNNSKALESALRKLGKLVKATEPPKPKEEKKAQEPEHYEATGEAKAEIDRLDSEIESLRDEDEQKNSAKISARAKRRDDIQDKVDNIEKLKAKRAKKENERVQAKSEGKTQVVNRLTSEIADVNNKIKSNEQKLDELLNPRNEDDELVETYEPVNSRVKAKLDDLDSQIENLTDDANAKEKLERERREIQNQNDIVAKLQAEKRQLQSDLSKKMVRSRGYKKIENAIDNKSKAISNAEKNLDKLIEPPKQKSKQEQPKPKKQEPVTEETRKALEALKRDIKKLDTKISNAETDLLVGKTNSGAIKELTDNRAEKKALLKEIQSQNDKCAELKDKAATALRIVNDNTKPQDERDKASDALQSYGAQLRDELQILQDLLPTKPSNEKTKASKTTKEKTPQSHEPAKENIQPTSPKEKINPKPKKKSAKEQSQVEQSPAPPIQETHQKETVTPLANEQEQSQNKLTESAETIKPITQEQTQSETTEQTSPEQESLKQNNEDEELNLAIKEARESLAEEYNTDDGSIFGSIESARQRLFEVFGIKPTDRNDIKQTEPTAQTEEQQKDSLTDNQQEDTRRPKLVNFVDDSEENEKRLIAEITAELNKLSANPVFNPKIWTKMLELGGIYVQRGINNFADWARKMTGTLGKESEPWQSAIWETINSVPENEKFNKEQMMAVAGYMGALREKKQIVSLTDVQKQLEFDVGKEWAKKISPMIEASYKGVEKFFTDRNREQEKSEQESPKEQTQIRTEKDESIEEQTASRQEKEDGFSNERNESTEKQNEEQSQSAVVETPVNSNVAKQEAQMTHKTFGEIAAINYAIVNKALRNYPIFAFDKLKLRFPDLGSMRQFINDAEYLGDVAIDIKSDETEPSIATLYSATLEALGKIAVAMDKAAVTYKDTSEFRDMAIQAVSADKNTIEPQEFPAYIISRATNSDIPKIHADNKRVEKAVHFFEKPNSSSKAISEIIRENDGIRSVYFENVDAPNEQKQVKFKVIPKHYINKTKFRQRIYAMAKKLGAEINEKDKSYPVFYFQRFSDACTFLEALRIISDRYSAPLTVQENLYFRLEEEQEENAQTDNNSIDKTTPSKRQTETNENDEKEIETRKSKQKQYSTDETSTETRQADKIVYPEGALTIGNKKISEKFKSKDMSPGKQKKFDEMMNRKVKINGREMTRLEVVESMAKGELDESAMKLNKGEREYLDYVNEVLIEPLKTIQAAGIQSETAPKRYSLSQKTVIDVIGNVVGARSLGVVLNKYDSKDKSSLSNLEKVANVIGGVLTEDMVEKAPEFLFGNIDDQHKFMNTASLFLDNNHLPYFSHVTETENQESSIEEKTSDVEKESVVENRTRLKNISMPKGIEMKQDIEQLQLLGTELEGQLANRIMTQSEAFEIIDIWEDALDEVNRKLLNKSMTHKEAEEKLRSAIKKIEDRVMGKGYTARLMKRLELSIADSADKKPVEVLDNASETEKENALAKNLGALERLLGRLEIARNEVYEFGDAYGKENSPVDTNEKEIVERILNELGDRKSSLQESMYSMLDAVEKLMKQIKNIPHNLLSHYNKIMHDIQVYEGIISSENINKEETSKTEQGDKEETQTEPTKTANKGEADSSVGKLAEGYKTESERSNQKGTLIFDRSAPLPSDSNDRTAPNGNVSENVGTDVQSATEKSNVPSLEISQVPDAKSPSLNVRNDPVETSADNVIQAEQGGKKESQAQVDEEKTTQDSTSEDNPFNVKLPENPSEEFNQAYSEMQEIWQARQNEKINDRKVAERTLDSVSKYQQAVMENLNAHSRYEEELRTLTDIRSKIVDEHKSTDKDTTDEPEEATSNGEESGESKRLDDGHRDVEPAVRTDTEEEIRQEGRSESTGRNTGRERQARTGNGERNSEPNAESERPVQEDDAGSTGTRTGEGTGVRGNSETLHPTAGDERGRSGISTDVENVSDKLSSENVSKPYEATGHNFQIMEESGIGEGGLKTKFKQNIDAIKLLKQLENEGRKATPSEQAILAKFNGWGTVASAFSNDPKWQKENQQLRELLTPEEYESAHGAITNAFYTSPEVATAMWQGLERLGFKGGRILDPSMGSGIFFGTMPMELTTHSELTGVELDSLTGRIAQQLYQKADVEITGFQNRALPNNYFDLAISNVPFSSVRILEDPAYRKEGFQLHDYFFAKAMDKVRPGGLVAFITSTGTLNDPQQLHRRFNQQADLIAAFKLPSNAFDKNSGTQVTTDIVIFQKRFDARKPSENAQDWHEVSRTLAPKKGSDVTFFVSVNEYFEKHPDHMLGKPMVDTLWSGGNRLALDGTGRDVVKELGDLMSKLPENIYSPIQHAMPSTLDNTLAKISATQLDGTFTMQDGKIYQKQDNKLVEMKGSDAKTVKDYLSLLKNLDALMKAELDPDATNEKISELRKGLNQKYDTFVKNNGYLNAPKNLKVLSNDPNYGRVAAIEDYREDKKTKQVYAKKADIFSKRTVSAIVEPTTADTAVDGLSVSLSLRGRVDMNYISDLTGKNELELEHELGDLIYRNPLTNQHELAEEYLSGNVREKLLQAHEAARTNPAFKRNVKALEKVQPLDLTEHDIAPHLGATWIKPEHYEAFIQYMLGNQMQEIKVIYNGATGEWIIEGYSTYGENYYKWRVSDTKWDFINLLEAAMNKITPTVTKDKKIDEAKTAEAREKIEQLKNEFEKWIWTDATRKRDLLDTYNAEFNSEVLRNYDGSSLTFPGLAQDVQEKLYRNMRRESPLL